MKREFKAVEKDLVVEVDVPPPGPSPSIFVVAGHKSGSTLITNILKDIVAETGFPAIPVEAEVWRQGFSVPDWPKELYDLLNEPGYLFYSFRWLQKLPTVPAFATAKKIFLVRDPRDVAVSYYFSMAKAHPIPKAAGPDHGILELRKATDEMDIDEFIQNGKANDILKNVEKYATFFKHSNSLFFRYEDVIFKKCEWISRLSKEIGVDLSEDVMDKISDRHDFFPSKENPNEHIRNVTPGDYKNKLSSDSIAFIEKNHPTFFNVFEYKRT